MPKVSSAPEDALHFQGKWIDGWGKVIDSKSVIFQFPPMKEAKGTRPVGHQDPPALYCELTIQRYLDGDGNKAASEPETKLLGIARPSRETGNLDLVHPGNYPEGNLELEPVDAGAGLGAEGNTVFALADGYQFNDKCGYMAFTASLVEDGFKPQVLKRTYFPDFIGLYAYFQTVTKPKFRDDMEGEPSAFVVKKGSTKIYPYEKVLPPTGTKGRGKTNHVAGPETTAAAPATPATPAADGSGSGSGTESGPESIAIGIVKSVAAKKKGASVANTAKLKVEFLMGINQQKPPVPADSKKAVMDFLNNEDWLVAQGMVTELFSQEESGGFKFAG